MSSQSQRTTLHAFDNDKGKADRELFPGLVAASVFN